MKIFSLLNKDAKILYDTMKELQIPENQLYLHDDESCPCGSGKSYNTEIASIQKAIEEQKNTLKEKKTALKKAEKEAASLEAKKAKADAKAAEEAKKAEAESVVKKLLASGMSADEILEKLK